MFNKIKTLHVLPRWIIIIIDAIIFSFAALSGYLLRLNFVIGQLYEFNFLRGIFVFTLCGIIASVITRSFAGIIRYTGIQDTLRVLYATVITLLLVICINYLSRNTLPYSIGLIAFFVALVLLISYRLLVKELFSFYRTVPRQQKKVLIFGAGESGMITKQVLNNDTKSNVKVIGFMEDNTRKVGKVLAGVRIYSARGDFKKIVDKYDPSELILAVNSLSLERKNELVDQCLEFGIRISSVPSADKWIGGEFNIHQISEVKIEDLLGRNTIILKNKYVGKELNGKHILVTGAAGSIGSEIVRQIVRYNPQKLILLDQSETGLFELENEIKSLINMEDRLVCFVADVSNKDRMDQLFKTYAPQIVFHAAAYKHVPMMERNVPEAIQCNFIGTKNLADLSVEHEVSKFVMVSTDKAVNPTSVMGASKRAAEIYVQSLNNSLSSTAAKGTKFITTRFGNVLGSNGSVIPIFKKQIMNGGPITVTHRDITRYFMTISEACSLVLEAGVMGEGGEIFVFDMGKSVKIVDLARRMIQLSGLTEGKDIEIVFTGLRPGEKLYEELFSDAENTLATHHPKIMIAEVREIAFQVIEAWAREIAVLLEEGNRLEAPDLDESLIKHLKKLMKEFKTPTVALETY